MRKLNTSSAKCAERKEYDIFIYWSIPTTPAKCASDVCASKMIDDYLYPREQERVLKNRINRRRNFLNREWRYKSDTGNYTLRYKGENITILKSNYGGFGVVFQGKICWRYNGRKIPNLSIAKIVAFDLFDELHDSKGQPQPHWDDGRWLYK